MHAKMLLCSLFPVLPSMVEIGNSRNDFLLTREFMYFQRCQLELHEVTNRTLYMNVMGRYIHSAS